MSPEQRHLFDTEPEPWEADDQAEQLVATVVLSAGPAQEFDYCVPDALRDAVEPGRRVQVPLGPSNRLVVGYCVRLENRPAGRRRLKPLHAVLDARSLLSPAMLRLTQWIADHYLCDWAAVLDAVVPAGVRAGAGTRHGHAAVGRRRSGRAAAGAEAAGEATAVLEVSGGGQGADDARRLARAARCTPAPSPRCGARG